MYTPHSLGKQGEALAAEYLTGRGYRLVCRNYRFFRNEIDIIASCREALCFIEVKTRASLEKGHPAEAVTPQKQKEIIRAAKAYLAALGQPDTTCRFDVIAILAHGFENGRITACEIEHIPAAFLAE
jgi:putative endonuclease